MNRKDVVNIFCILSTVVIIGSVTLTPLLTEKMVTEEPYLTANPTLRLGVSSHMLRLGANSHMVRVIQVRIGTDVYVGEDKPAKLSSQQDFRTSVLNCLDMENALCVQIMLKNGESYPINYEDGTSDIWTVNEVKPSQFLIVRSNGKQVELGLKIH